MHWLSYGVALLAAAGIMGIGTMYLLRPRVMTHNFGLPLPEEGRNTTWWLRLKGSRDIVSGLVVLALMAWGTPYLLGIVLLIEGDHPNRRHDDHPRSQGLHRHRARRPRRHRGANDRSRHSPHHRSCLTCCTII